jgi:hypothetical protein
MPVLRSTVVLMPAAMTLTETVPVSLAMPMSMLALLVVALLMPAAASVRVPEAALMSGPLPVAQVVLMLMAVAGLEAAPRVLERPGSRQKLSSHPRARGSSEQPRQAARPRAPGQVASQARRSAESAQEEEAWPPDSVAAGRTLPAAESRQVP